MCLFYIFIEYFLLELTVIEVERAPTVFQKEELVVEEEPVLNIDWSSSNLFGSILSGGGIDVEVKLS